MTENAKKILDNLMQEVTAEKALSFIREKVFSDGINIPCKTYLSGTYDARGYNQWKEAERTVKKGAKALYILVPMIYKVKDKPDANEEESKQLKGFKAMPVFKVEDTEGGPFLKGGSCAPFTPRLGDLSPRPSLFFNYYRGLPPYAPENPSLPP